MAQWRRRSQSARLLGWDNAPPHHLERVQAAPSASPLIRPRKRLWLLPNQGDGQRAAVMPKRLLPAYCTIKVVVSHMLIEISDYSGGPTIERAPGVSAGLACSPSSPLIPGLSAPSGLSKWTLPPQARPGHRGRCAIL